jgi:ornithine decarboxylase
MLKTLESLGCSFDCASKGEIELVLGLGVDASRIIYANPCKQISALKYLIQFKITPATMRMSVMLLC